MAGSRLPEIYSVTFGLDAAHAEQEYKYLPRPGVQRLHAKQRLDANSKTRAACLYMDGRVSGNRGVEEERRKRVVGDLR